MNKYYCQLNLVLIWLLELTLFRTYVYSLPVVIKKCLNPLTLRKFIQLFPNSIKKFLVTFMKKTIPGFESRKEIGLFLFGGQQVSPSLLLMILAKLLPNCQPPGPLYPTQRRPLAESTSQTATHLDKLGTALQGCFSFFQGTRQFSWLVKAMLTHTGRANHSCRPNCEFHWCQQRGVQVIRLGEKDGVLLTISCLWCLVTKSARLSADK